MDPLKARGYSRSSPDPSQFLSLQDLTEIVTWVGKLKRGRPPVDYSMSCFSMEQFMFREKNSTTGSRVTRCHGPQRLRMLFWGVSAWNTTSEARKNGFRTSRNDVRWWMALVSSSEDDFPLPTGCFPLPCVLFIGVYPSGCWRRTGRND